MIYEHILDGNKKFNTNTVDIVRSGFTCDPETINKVVIIAPVWKPDLFSNYLDSIDQISDGMYKIWNMSIKGKKITYIITGIGAPCLMDAILALGCTPCEKIIFIGSVGGLGKNINIGDIVIPEYSICGDGACRY